MEGGESEEEWCEMGEWSALAWWCLGDLVLVFLFGVLEPQLDLLYTDLCGLLFVCTYLSKTMRYMSL